MNKKILKEYEYLRKERSALLVPNYEQVLTENFSYTNYLKDAILYTKGIYTGYFDGYDEVDISKLLSTGKPAKKKNFDNSFYNTAEKKLRDLATEYFSNIGSSLDEELDKSISLRMVSVVSDASDSEREYIKALERQTEN